MSELEFSNLLLVAVIAFATTQIGRELGLVTAASAAGLVAAGLLSVLLFSLAATTLLRGSPA